MLEHPWDERSVDFPIDDRSLVLEIGGYQGRWARAICERHPCRVFAFEPQLWAYQRCRDELKDFPNAHVFNFGLGVEDGTFPMYDWETDGCTFVLKDSHVDKPKGEGRLVEINRAITRLGVGKRERIDLVLMNIEGYEFQLIPHMLRTGLMDRIRFFACQFHTKDVEDELAYMNVTCELDKRMDVRFNYHKTLTCWEAREKKKVEGNHEP